jgi:putative heme-binding domain-containing protein
MSEIRGGALKPVGFVLATSCLLVWAATTDAAAQSAGQIEQGKQLFQGMCARCHGADGRGELGPNLHKATLSNAPDDDALRNVIREGIPDRGMPRMRRLTDTEMDQLVAFVRSLGRTNEGTVVGDAARGAEVYKKLGCSSCHIVTGTGGSFGPDLTEIGASRGPSYLRQSFLGPAEMLPIGTSLVPGRGFAEYLPVRIVTNDGHEVHGVRINEDPFTIQVRDLNNRYYSFRKSDLKEFDKEFGKSVMPSFRGRVTDTESDDLIAYLSSLRGGR